MKRILLLLLALTTFTITLQAAPTRASLAQSANGWSYVNSEWVHPDGYMYENGRVLRTTAQRGKPVPRPPGKLALENAEQLAPATAPAPSKPEADRKAEERRKNLQARPAPQTGSHF